MKNFTREDVYNEDNKWNILQVVSKYGYFNYDVNGNTDYYDGGDWDCTGELEVRLSGDWRETFESIEDAEAYCLNYMRENPNEFACANGEIDINKLFD
jgi:hypothetical protein